MGHRCYFFKQLSCYLKKKKKKWGFASQFGAGPCLTRSILVGNTYLLTNYKTDFALRELMGFYLTCFQESIKIFLPWFLTDINSMASFHFSSDSNRLSCFYTCCNSILRQEINRIRHKAQGRDGDSVQMRPNEWEFTFPKACNSACDLNPTGKIDVISLLLLLSALQCAATILQQHVSVGKVRITQLENLKSNWGKK